MPLSNTTILFDSLVRYRINYRLVSEENCEGIPRKDWLRGEAPPSEPAVPSGSRDRRKSEDKVWPPACLPSFHGASILLLIPSPSFAAIRISFLGPSDVGLRPVTLQEPSRPAVLNLWVKTPLGWGWGHISDTLPIRYLHYNS